MPLPHPPTPLRSAAKKDGYAIHVYACNASMVDSSFTNADGDYLIVPQMGGCRCRSGDPVERWRWKRKLLFRRKQLLRWLCVGVKG